MCHGGRAYRGLFRVWVCVLAIVLIAVPARAQRRIASAPPKLTTASSAHLTDSDRAHAILNQQPIRFEPLAEKGMFLARGMGPAIRLSGTSIDFPINSGSSHTETISVQFVGARKSSRVTGLDPLPGRINYLYGDDPARWRTNIPTYARAHSSELYRGIDVDYYGAGGLLEYDLMVRPESRTDVIRLAVSGASAAISEDGDLVYGADRRVLLRKPVAYQTIDGARREVTVEYRRRGDGTFGFAVGSYDRRQLLIIDPVVEYSFAFGGGSDDAAADMAVDDLGAVYIGGTTTSVDFPAVNPVSDRQDAGSTCRTGIEFNTAYCSDGFLAKLRPDGAALEYATYLGVWDFDTVGHVAVDASHALYFSAEGSGPVFVSIPNVSDVIGKIAPDGSLIYRTLIPPSYVTDLAIGPDGSAYMLSNQAVATLSPAGDSYHLIYSPPLGALGLTYLRAIATDGHSLFVAGNTGWPGFPTTPGAAQTHHGGYGQSEGLILRMTLEGAVTYTTFLGGASDENFWDLSVDSEGAVYVVGSTMSQDFPHLNNASDWDPSVVERSVVAKVNAGGESIAWATLLPYPVHQSSSLESAIRIALVGGTNVYTAACVYWSESGQSGRDCQSSTIGATGVLQSVYDVPSRLFAVDQTGARYFAVATGNVVITKYGPGPALALTSLTANEPSPARFATQITWTAGAIADGEVEYSFVRYSATDGWIEAQAFGPSPAYTWTPGSWDVGEHELCVLARLVGTLNTPVSRCVEFTIAGVGPGEAPVFLVASDFNQDRRPDLLWTNTATGQMAMWNLGGGDHGERVLGGGYLNSPALPAGWRVAGTADIDGDGQTDLFLQSDTGLLGAWLFDGSTLRSGITLTPGQVGDPNWQIRAVGDLNHDGHPDLIWQYAPTGQVAFWLMNGTSAIGYIVPNVTAPGGDWEIVGTGDSNRDGERDIFWQQRSTGTLAVWWMNGTSVVDGSLLSASPGDPKWRVVGVADLDGDAYSDLIFQHDDTHMTAAWYLSGETVRFGLTLIPSTVGDPAWKIAGPR